MSDRAALTASPVTPDQAAEFMRGRRSVVRFEPELPAAEILRAAVEVARWAPNHRLTNPWRFYVLGPQGRDRVIALNTALVAQSRGEEQAADKDKRWRAVPGWLVVTCRDDGNEITAREDYAATACATQNLMLYLHSAGVATKWTTGAVTRSPTFFDACGIQIADGEYCAGLLWYGYPARDTQSRRAPVDDILLFTD